MDCIPFINDLEIELEILYDLKRSGSSSIELIDKQIIEKEKVLLRCKENIKKLSINKVYYRIYSKILDGLNPSKAIEEVAQENYINDVKPSSIPGLWIYYREIKKIINL